MRQPPYPLDLEVLHGKRHEETFQATGDPGDPDWLKKQLRGWLKAEKWHRDRWGEFWLVARPAGQWKKLAKVQG